MVCELQSVAGKCRRTFLYIGQTMPAAKSNRPKFSNQPKQSRQTKVKRLSSKTVFRGKVFDVISERVREPNGVVAVRDVVRHSGSVVILAVDDAGREPRVLLEKQYRYAAEDYLWELPAGRIDPREKALAGARRELQEETGYRAGSWKRALFFYPSPGFLDETMTVYLASGLIPGEANPEADEDIDCEMVPLSRVVSMVLSGGIRDGKTIAAVLWLAEVRRGQPSRA
jgi:ADP-ribose pyrophosphatase